MNINLEKEQLRMKLLVAWLLWWKFDGNTKQYRRTLYYIRKQQAKNGMSDGEIFNVFGKLNPAKIQETEELVFNFRSFILDSMEERETFKGIKIPKSIKARL